MFCVRFYSKRTNHLSRSPLYMMRQKDQEVCILLLYMRSWSRERNLSSARIHQIPGGRMQIMGDQTLSNVRANHDYNLSFVDKFSAPSSFRHMRIYFIRFTCAFVYIGFFVNRSTCSLAHCFFSNFKEIFARKMQKTGKICKYG